MKAIATKGGGRPCAWRGRWQLLSLSGGVGLVLLSVALAQAASFLYVADANHTVAIIDTTSHSVIARVPVGAGPTSVAVHPAGTRVYVANVIAGPGGNVSVIDTATHTVSATIPLLSPGPMVIDPSGTSLYVANGTSGPNIAVIDTTRHTIRATIPVVFAESKRAIPTTMVMQPGW